MRTHHCVPLHTCMQGMVIEIAKGGDLREYYSGKTEQPYTFHAALTVILGVAKGLLYMHSMPVPVVHRDIKSANVLIMSDGTTGKIGDCGESRRIDLNSTMTQTGSPLWAAPELLSGKRYEEDIDTFSFGVLMYEIVARAYPYEQDIEAYGSKNPGHNKAVFAKKLMKEVADGELGP